LLCTIEKASEYLLNEIGCFFNEIFPEHICRDTEFESKGVENFIPEGKELSL
jgi:hypothetical protein